MESDQHLAERWRRGDERAAATLVEKYADAMGAVAYAALRDYGQAEEAVQEALYRAVKRLDTLESGARVGAWLVGIARHVAQDMSRRNHIRRERAQAPAQAKTGAPPDLEASRNELRSALEAVLDRLPEDQRELFAMKYLAGLRYDDIARLLGTTREAVGQKLWRIRTKLQAQLEAFRP